MAWIDDEPDVAVVGRGQDLGLWVAVDSAPGLDQANEGLIFIVLPVKAPDLALIYVIVQQTVARCQCPRTMPTDVTE